MLALEPNILRAVQPVSYCSDHCCSNWRAESVYGKSSFSLCKWTLQIYSWQIALTEVVQSTPRRLHHVLSSLFVLVLSRWRPTKERMGKSESIIFWAGIFFMKRCKCNASNIRSTQIWIVYKSKHIISLNLLLNWTFQFVVSERHFHAWLLSYSVWCLEHVAILFFRLVWSLVGVETTSTVDSEKKIYNFLRFRRSEIWSPSHIHVGGITHLL